MTAGLGASGEAGSAIVSRAADRPREPLSAAEIGGAADKTTVMIHATTFLIAKPVLTRNRVSTRVLPLLSRQGVADQADALS